MKKTRLFISLFIISSFIGLIYWLCRPVSLTGFCGNYTYKAVYINYLGEGPFDSRDEHYTLTEDTLTIQLEDGSVPSYPITLQWKKIETIPELIARDVSTYSQRHLLVEDSEYCPYRIYVMDDEIWLVNLVRQERRTGEIIRIFHWVYIIEPEN